MRKRNPGQEGGEKVIKEVGGITVPDLLLAKMISNNNRNQAQRDAMIDTMNKSQVQ